MSAALPRASRQVRATLGALVPSSVLARPDEAEGEAQLILQSGERLHEALTRLPRAGANRRCIVVGSRGVEAPYLAERLGWREITCLSPTTGRARGLRSAARRGERQVCRRVNHQTGRVVEYEVVECDLEESPWPLASERFGLALFWGCLEHLRRDPEFALYELNRVCAAGASASVMTDNPISLKATHCVIRGHPLPLRLHGQAETGPCRLYAPHELTELLEGTGWRVEAMTSIVPQAPASWGWWKTWRMRRLLAHQRSGFGLVQPYWNAHLLAHATRAAGPMRSFPTWLYQEEKIRELKIDMMELIARQPTAMAS